MSPEAARIGSAAGGDIVLSIDAMGGDRGIECVVLGMAKSLKKNPRLRYIVHGDEAALRSTIHRRSLLEERSPRPRVLFISGYANVTLAELASLGRLLPKPFTPAKLVSAVALALGDDPPGPERSAR